MDDTVRRSIRRVTVPRQDANASAMLPYLAAVTLNQKTFKVMVNNVVYMIMKSGFLPKA